MNDYRIRLQERGEYETGRQDWRAGRWNRFLTGDAKKAYELGRWDAQYEAMLKAEREEEARA